MNGTNSCEQRVNKGRQRASYGIREFKVRSHALGALQGLGHEDLRNNDGLWQERRIMTDCGKDDG